MPRAAENPEHLEERQSEDRAGMIPGGSPPGDESQDRALAEAALRWQETLRGLEEKVREATEAINFLRESLREVAPLLRGVGELDTALRSLTGATPGPRAYPSGVPASGLDVPPAAPAASTTAAEGPWSDDLPSTPESSPPVAEKPATRPTGLDLLPQSYTVTVEDRQEDDRRSKVDLAPLHRALMDMEGVRDLRLVGYAHGIATIALELQGEIDVSKMQSAIGEAMQRECTVLARDEQRIHVRMAER
jgi:hypothetical protein